MDQVFHVEIEAFVCVVTEAWYVGTVATANNIWGVTADNIWGVNLSCKAPVAP